MFPSFIAVFAAILITIVYGKTVSYDRRAITIDGQRKLLFAGSVHYPRATADMWPAIFRHSKEAGINAIDTYVFWNEHEPERGQYDFSGNKDLRKFVQLAQAEGLYVVLRIGPFVCAEWNYGGFPAWLREIEGIDFRNDNEPFKNEMARFVTYIVDYMQDLLHVNGGPIILLQIENEYGHAERFYGASGHRYAQWSADFAQSLNASKTTPWFMCVQDNIPSILNTCNGFYCDQWVAGSRPYKDQPALWTENWTGWFMSWGDERPTRPAKDLAYAILRWIARGGTYTGHYMWFGGTNFGRSAGYLITTDYDYDAPVDQYGFKAEPKYSHMSKLQNLLLEFEDVIVNNNFQYKRLDKELEAHIYGDFERSDRSLMFVSNYGMGDDLTAQFEEKMFMIPRWSVSVIQGPLNRAKVLFNSASTNSVATEWEYKDSGATASAVIEGAREPVGIWDSDRMRFQSVPIEQLSLTADKTDYLWYVLKDLMGISDGSKVTLRLEEVNDHVYVYWNSKLVGASRGGDKIKISFVASGSTKDQNTLQILTQTLGLTNFGPHRQNWRRGITGKLFLNDRDITNSGWLHQVGLFGEKEGYSSGLKNVFGTIDQDLPLTWYRIRFPAVKEVSLENKDLAFAFDLGSMGKGHAWVNGNAIGRYWNITASPPGKPTDPYPGPFDGSLPCDYAGIFDADKCRLKTGDGKPTQRYYHVPRSWLSDSGENILVLFEETGGKPADIKLVTVERKPSSSSSFVYQNVI